MKIIPVVLYWIILICMALGIVSLMMYAAAYAQSEPFVDERQKVCSQTGATVDQECFCGELIVLPPLTGA